MRVLLLGLCGLINPLPAGAQAPDPPQSCACVQALAVLNDVEEALRPRTGAQAQAGSDQRLLRDRLVVLKQRAASMCLGRAAASASIARPVPAGPAVKEPLRQAGPPVTPSQPAARPPLAQTAPAPMPAPLLSLVSCDAAGCWASDGTRLQRSGTLLLGPRGYCSAAGSVLNCP